MLHTWMIPDTHTRKHAFIVASSSATPELCHQRAVTFPLRSIDFSRAWVRAKASLTIWWRRSFHGNLQVPPSIYLSCASVDCGLCLTQSWEQASGGGRVGWGRRSGRRISPAVSTRVICLERTTSAAAFAVAPVCLSLIGESCTKPKILMQNNNREQNNKSKALAMFVWLVFAEHWYTCRITCINMFSIYWLYFTFTDVLWF